MPTDTKTDEGGRRRPLPSVAVLATGGTISGLAADPDRPAAYDSGVLEVATLLGAVPDIGRYADVKGVQVANIGSEHMTDGVWLRLARVAAQVLAAPGMHGAVVLHGTDTMEETAYFLSLVLPPDKPLVMTGAMRPANAVSADGPMNILNAVRLAASPAARGMGVMVAMNDRILEARGAAKTDTLNLDAFRSPGEGPLGTMVDGEPRFARLPRRPARGGGFGLAGLDALPRVDIVYGHAGQGRELVDAAVAAGAKGIVHAGVGMGHVHRAALPALTEAAERGVAVVCSSRVGRGPVPSTPEMARQGFVAAGGLNPQKARVLLQLALTATEDRDEIRAMFELYS